MGFLKEVTGKGLTTSIALELTDLGIMRWDSDRNCVVAMFGDSFSFGWGQDWRSPTLACFDTDFNCLGVPIRGGIATQPAKQLWDYGHNNPDFSTVLPCDFIRVGSTWFVAVMLTQGLGKETMTEFWQSENLIDWNLTGFGFPHSGSDPCTTMLSFDQFGDDVYVVGTHGLRRDGPIKMWKCSASDFPKGEWLPVNNGNPILGGRYGELCLRNVQGNAVLSFFDEQNYRQTALCVADPENDWGQANRLDYVSGQELPQLYGGYISPDSKLDVPNGMKFFVSQWLTAGNAAYHVVAYAGTLPAKGPIVDTTIVEKVVDVTEKVLKYDHSQQRVAQEKFWDCGPASTQIVLQGAGVDMSEDQLIRELGTTTDGTNTVEQALPVLNRVTNGQYKAVWLAHDPPSQSETDALWDNIKGSIDAGFGCVLNFEVPSSNFPRGTRGSVSPSYRGHKIWHYVACMGYADDGPGGKHVWIADPGFAPFGYWMSLQQAASAIPPHAYAYASVQAAQEHPVLAPVSHVEAPEVHSGVSSRSAYRTPGEGPLGPLESVALNDDALLHQLWIEWSAVTIGDVESVYRVVRSAAGHGADTSPEFIQRAKLVLGKVDQTVLSRVLSKIQQVEPALLEALVK